MHFRSIRRRGVTAVAAGGLTLGALVVPAVALASPAGAATANVTYACTALGNDFDYPTDIDVTAVRSGNNVALTARLDPMPNTAPVTLPAQTMEGTLTVTVDGADAELTGSSVEDMTPNVPIPMPPLKGSVTTASNSLQVVADGFTLLAAGAVPITCVLESPVEIGAVAVKVPKPKAKATKTNTKVKWKKGKKKAIVKTTVKAGKTKATGKVRYVLKRGKKTVAKKNATLKRGVAKVNFKKGTFKKKGKIKKGKYVLTTRYLGNKRFKKSGDRDKFRVK